VTEAVASPRRELRAQLVFLDGLRGFAAFYVMVGHARWLLWEGYSEGFKKHPEQYSALGRAVVYLLASFRWGHEAVLFFFVLSGFVIHLRYARKIVRGASDFDLWPYVGRRARRLYPPLVAALVVTLALDLLGAHLQLPTVSHTTRYPLFNTDLGFEHGPRVLLRNLGFIMDPVFGSDAPLWSLNYEWYFYMIYPAVYMIARRSLKGATAAVAVLSVLGFAPIWSPALGWFRVVLQLMIAWWFGALLAERFAGRLKVGYGAVSGLVLAPLVLFIGDWNPFLRDIVVALGFTGLIAALLAHQERGGSLAPLERLRPLGDMSYTLYVLHFPILVFMSGLLLRARSGWLPQSFGWAGLGVLVCVSVAWAMHLIVERPFTNR
jgi:peptidoglycan/LPS O-acetylase OafA/YrhL